MSADPQSDAPLPVSSAHLAELRASGLSDATIRAACVRTERDFVTIQQILRWDKYYAQYGSALVFPFFDATGKRLFEYQRLKFEKPRTSKPTKDRPAKTIKYESPRGVPNRVYFPPGIAPIIANPAETLFITEGEKKSLKATQEGIPCIGLVGVFGFQKKRPKSAEGKPVGERELIPDLEAIAWQGRKVYIVYDSDAVTNENVLVAEYCLAQALSQRGASVLVVRLPEKAAV